MTGIKKVIATILFINIFTVWGQTTHTVFETDINNWFEIGYIQAQYEDATISFDESNPGYVHYRSPLVTFKASVQCHQPDPVNWKIGFVQIIETNRIIYTYKDSYTEWRFPTMPLSDSIGTEYPWYDGKNGYTQALGTANLYFDDNFNINVSWRQPLPPDGSKEKNKEELMALERNQSFLVWLVAYNPVRDRMVILKEIEWLYAFKAVVDCSKPRGQRCKLIMEVKPDPCIKNFINTNKLNYRVLTGPNANESQEFLLNGEIKLN